MSGGDGRGAGKEHRWSGWPGAFCLDCFQEDLTEICATSHAHADLDPERGICVVPCAAKQGPCVALPAGSDGAEEAQG
jgi:hypothetical protein